jgi:thiamine biosynthesis protein ThiS
MTAKMKIQINGQDRDCSAPLSLAALLVELGMKTDRVAVELNQRIVAREEWAGTTLHEGDRLEIVHFVGGGTCGKVGPPPILRYPSLTFGELA